MIPKHIFGLVALVAFLNGCCCAASDFAESASLGCSTFQQSCEKSCAKLDPSDYNGCVSECRSVLMSEGIDPGSCCPSDYKVRAVCEYECSYSPEIYTGPGTCIENCGQMIYQEMGIGLDDCVSPA